MPIDILLLKKSFNFEIEIKFFALKLFLTKGILTCGKYRIFREWI